MPHGSGLDAQLGVGVESTYGTRVAPTTFLPFESESLSLEQSYIENQPLMAGVMVQPSGYHVSSTRAASGSVELLYHDRGMGKLLSLLTGGSPAITTPGGGTISRRQTFNIGTTSPVGKSVSLQVGRPDTSGIVRPFDYVGCKVTEATISIEAGEAASLSLSIDAQDEKTDQTLATPTFSAAARPYGFKNWAISIAGSAHTRVRSLNITMPLNMEVGRYHLGNSGIKDEPLVNAPSEISASATLEFASLADHARFRSESVVALVATATNALIEGAIYYDTTITIPAAKQISSSPNVAGPDLVTNDVEFKALWDGTNPPLTIVNTNTDTAL
jgi:hypothetical protein